jgi:hypothetical protein
MRPKERRESGQKDLFKARLDQIVDLDHALAKLARTIDWRLLEDRFGAVYDDDPGRPPLPTRLMAGLAILCQRAAESPHFGACNFPQLAGLVISRLRDQRLHSLVVDRDALRALERKTAG